MDTFSLTDSAKVMREFLQVVNLATMFEFCFPVPSRRPDDVLAVLPLVWTDWARPMNHLISDVGGEFERE